MWGKEGFRERELPPVSGLRIWVEVRKGEKMFHFLSYNLECRQT